jgi:hypothetical protein
MGRAYQAGLVVAAVAAACACGGNGSPPTPTPTSAPPAPTPTATAASNVPDVPPPVVVIVTPGTNGNVVQRVTVSGTGLVAEELPFALPFAETAVSPSGGLLAYSDPALASPGIVIVDLVAITQRSVAVDGFVRAPPTWNDRGDHVAAVADGGGEAIAWWRDMTTGDGGETLLGPGAIGDLRWLPGGPGSPGPGFSFVRDGQAGFLPIGDAYVRLTAGERYEVREVAFAPDGTRAAVVRVERPPEPTPTVAPIPTDDAEATESPTPAETPPADEDATPQPSPTPPPAASWSLAIVARDGALLAELAPGFRDISRLRWIPALESVLGFVATGPSGLSGLWMLEPGLAPRLVYEGRVDDATWSHDGAYVAVVADGGECGSRTCPRGFLRVIELDTGTVYRTDSARVLGAPAWERPD